MAATYHDRATAWSAQLAQAHNTLRHRLREVQAALGATSSAESPGDMVTHCLAFCQALTTHHTGEDAGLFDELRRVRPDLASVIDNLIDDHSLIASIIARISSLAGEAQHAEPQRIREISNELDGLAAIMESHFTYERRISAAIDGLVDTGWVRVVLRLDA